MHQRRIFVDLDLSTNATVTLPEPASIYLSKVLRCRTGDTVQLFSGDGRQYDATLLASPNNQKQARVISASEVETAPALQIHLGLALSKGERMDFALQKSVELGVSQITPIFSQNTIVRLDEQRLEKRGRHWESVIISASEQSGRCRLPELHSAQDFSQFLSSNPSGLMLTPDATLPLAATSQPSTKVVLVIGPEGGFSDTEKRLALIKEYKLVRLGPRILRAETAPLAAIAAIQALWGDFRD